MFKLKVTPLCPGAAGALFECPPAATGSAISRSNALKPLG